MSFFRTVVGGALGFMVGGPLGGAVLANTLGGNDNKYNITCPHCHKSLGVNDHGRYSCCHCNNYLLFSDDGVIKDTRIDVRCPHCNCDLLIDGPGKWNCCECNKSFDYEEEKLLNFAIGILKIDPHFISSLKEEFLNNNLDKYYEILGCKKGDSLDTIKSNYRKIVNECHPDRISNKDLPEYLIKYSTERFCQVQEAYEKIKLS